MAFAAHQFQLSARQKDGSTLRDQLTSYEEQTGVQHPMLADAPGLPDDLAPLWDHFLNLHATRSVGMAESPITYEQVDAYQRVTRTVFEGWEIGAIRAADRSYFASKPKNADG